MLLFTSKQTAKSFHPLSAYRRLGSCLRTIAPAPAFTAPHRHSSTHPALAPTQKSLNSPLHHSSSAEIASQRTAAIHRHLSTGRQPSSSDNMSYGKGSSEFSARQIKPKHTLDYRCYIEKNGTPVSPFHDIPLYANDAQTILNMIVEIPRWSNAKLEVRKTVSKLQELNSQNCRFPRKSTSTPSSKTLRRASCDSFATAFLTRATSGTMAPSPEYVPSLSYADSKTDDLADLGRPQRCPSRDQGQR
jgi:hypothetical protein